MHLWAGAKEFPPVITVFSAPNYCGEYNNKGAVILIENEKMSVKQYIDVEHPFQLPNNIDALTWSMPFITEKIHQMMSHLATTRYKMRPGEIELPTPTGNKVDSILKQQRKDVEREIMKKQQVRSRRRTKIMMIARWCRMLNIIRIEQEKWKKLKKKYPILP